MEENKDELKSLTEEDKTAKKAVATRLPNTGAGSNAEYDTFKPEPTIRSIKLKRIDDNLQIHIKGKPSCDIYDEQQNQDELKKFEKLTNIPQKPKNNGEKK